MYLASIRADRTSYQNSQPLYGRGLVASLGLSKPNLSKPRSPFILLPNSFILHTTLLFQTSFAITQNNNSIHDQVKTSKMVTVKSIWLLLACYTGAMTNS